MQNQKDNMRHDVFYKENNLINQRNYDVVLKCGIRADKIAAATYLVTDLFSDQEPLKYTLRQLSLDLASACHTPLSSASITQSFSLLQMIDMLIGRIEISTVAGLVSEMNGTILKNELVSLRKDYTHSYFGNDNGVFGGSVAINIAPDLHAQFFTQDTTKSSSPHVSSTENQNDIKTTFNTIQNDIQKNSEEETKQRREKILYIISEKRDVTIKDITDNVKDCSDKTIQRDLNALIVAGSIVKVGNKRWSRYVLASGKRLS